MQAISVPAILISQKKIFKPKLKFGFLVHLVDRLDDIAEDGDMEQCEIDTAAQKGWFWAIRGEAGW